MTSHVHESHGMAGRHTIKTKMASKNNEQRNSITDLHFPKTGYIYIYIYIYIYTAQSITTMPGPIKLCVSKPSDKLQANGSSNDHMRYHTHWT